DTHPWAPVFFVPYILLSAFTVLNLFIAVIVDAMQHLRDDDAADTIGSSDAADDTPADAVGAAQPDDVVAAELQALRAQVAELSELIRARGGDRGGTIAGWCCPGGWRARTARSPIRCCGRWWAWAGWPSSSTRGARRIAATTPCSWCSAGATPSRWPSPTDPGVDWLKNLRAAGGGRLRLGREL